MVTCIGLKLEFITVTFQSFFMSFNKLTLTLLLLLPIGLMAQSPYQIDWKKEPYFFATGALAMGSGLYIHSQLESLTSEEILTLNRSDVNSFDRNATFNFSSGASSASDVFFLSSYTLPALFMAHPRTRNDFGNIMVLYGETILLTKGITNVTKRSATRPRPFVYNELVNLDRKQKKSARFSFFSGHTSITATNYFFTAKVFSDYFPDSDLKPFVWAVAVITPAVTGQLRVKAGKHFQTDVMCGYALGAFVGYMIPHLHKVQKDKPLTVLPAPNGLMMTWQFSK